MAGAEFPRVVWEFIAATNAKDVRWLETLFTQSCSVTACGLHVAGLAAVRRWIEAEVLEPSMSLALDDACCDGAVTTLLVRAADHGSTYDSRFEFRTQGRYIESLKISALPES